VCVLALTGVAGLPGLSVEHRDAICELPRLAVHQGRAAMAGSSGIPGIPANSPVAFGHAGHEIHTCLPMPVTNRHYLFSSDAFDEFAARWRIGASSGAIVARGLVAEVAGTCGGGVAALTSQFAAGRWLLRPLPSSASRRASRAAGIAGDNATSTCIEVSKSQQSVGFPLPLC
jgi:hypothetical protein